MALEINLSQLRCLCATLKTGSFSKAADELCVSEPAVFVQVRSLERFIGFKLVEKFKKELVPTEVGKIMYDYGEKIFGLVEEATSAVRELRDLKGGYLRLGVTRVICQYLMPSVISLFQDQYPRINVHLDEGRSQELVEGVVRHRYEIAIVAKVPYPKEINAISFSRDEVWLVVSPDNQLLRKKKVSFQELAEEPVIFADSGSAIRSAIQNAFEKRGLKPLATIEAADVEFIKRLVRQGKGYSFLASLCVRDEIREGELATVALDEGQFSLDIDVIHLREKALSPAASAFLHFLQENRKTNKLGKLTDAMARKASGGQKQPRIRPDKGENLRSLS